MGFFSWRTSDTAESVSNKHSTRGALPVKMLSPDGRVFEERDYDGYGRFGGKDFYELVAQLNDVSEFANETSLRSKGIALAFSGRPCIKPKIVTINCKKPYFGLIDSPDCERQGYFYGK